MFRYGRLQFLGSIFFGVVSLASPFLLLVLRFLPVFSLHVVCFRLQFFFYLALSVFFCVWNFLIEIDGALCFFPIRWFSLVVWLSSCSPSCSVAGFFLEEDMKSCSLVAGGWSDFAHYLWAKVGRGWDRSGYYRWVEIACGRGS